MSDRERAPRTTRLLAWVIAGVLRHRSVALISVAIAVAAAGLGLARLQVDFSSTAFYGDASAAAQRLVDHRASWGADDDTLLVLIEPSDADDPAGVLSRERLDAIAGLSRALADASQVEQVVSIATLTLPLPPQLGSASASATFPSVAAGLGLAQLDPAQRRALLERMPFVPTLLSADGSVTVIMVELSFSTDDVLRARSVVDELEALIASHQAKQGNQPLAEVGLIWQIAGVPAVRAGFMGLVVRDQLLLVPLTLLVIGLALFVVFRRLHGVVIPAIAAGLPTLMLVGIMGWTGEGLGLLNQAYFSLLPVIVVADAIHLLARYHEERRAGADSRDQAIVRAGSRVGVACLLTSLTTATGFASLALADMPILRGFGLYAALGVVLAFVTVIVLVPMLLTFVRDDRHPPPLPGLRWVDAVVGLAIRRPWAVVIGSVGLMLLALVPASRVEIDNQISGLLEPTHPTSVASETVDERLGGVLGLELELRAPPGVDLREPQLLAAIHGFELWLAEQAGVRTVEGVASIVAGAGELLGEPTTVPSSRAAIDARLAAVAAYAPLDRFVRDSGQHLRIHAGMPDFGGQKFVAIADRAEAELARRLAAVPGGEQVQAYATGTALLAYRGVNAITNDVRDSFVLVFAVIVGVIAVLFRSLWPALIGLLPNGAPLLLGYAMLGVLGQVLDPLAAVILTLALGIAVDDTLHIMVRTREELRDGSNLETALRRAVGHTGRAVLVTSVVIVGGLSLEMLSSFPPMQLLGLLGGGVIGFAVVLDLLLLPALIVLSRGRGLS
ncbi:efflux RND transporter permease subunit [Enhygromyxa salina]|uniref:Membrane transport protein mmpL8 n=1 Tax=Enhygromyxa salina TaxID=215803 RepID=A0A2S9YXP7_9BACT|nr:MMPL family transporter [Enhygromyxa salina]PRQ09854.1 Membrane transport protein mmpL8 [Enhygromyxa salina]